MRFFSLLLLTILCTCVRAQTLTGRITDAESGEPLAFASIYVEQTKSGAASNADGYFQVKLAGGSNRVVFSYLGYTSQTKTVSGTSTLEVKLTTESLDLQQVEVLSSGEDISYSVIRRAIAKAEFHENQLDAYAAEVYIKGTGKVNKLPGLLKAFASREDKQEMEEVLDQPFTTESTSKVEYTRPNNFKQVVLSSYVVGDEQFNASPYIFTSFYQPYVAEQIVSPLSPRAFGYYKFVHEGVFVDQDELINRIRVIPRSKGEDIFEGYINVVQDDWSLHSLDLTTYKLGFAVRIKRTYAEIQEHVWLPISTTLDADGQIFGLAMEYHYLSTISNYDLTLNPELGGYVEVIDEKTQPDKAAAVKKQTSASEMESVLADGGELTRKDMRKLLKSYRQQEQRETEAPEVVRNSTFITDSARVVTDSARWAAIRPVPLTALERRGYARLDSIQRIERAEAAKVEAEGGVSVQAGGREVSINTNPNKEKAWNIKLAPEPFFSPVEGYAPGLSIRLSEPKKTFTTRWRSRYGLSSERLLYQGQIGVGKSGIRGNTTVSRFELTGGRFLRQFDRQQPIDPWFNVFTTLLSGDNYINYYERDFAELRYNQQFGDRLTGRLRLGYESRSALTNQSNSNWWGLAEEEVYDANAPVNAARGVIDLVVPAATAQLSLTWRPGLQFEVRNGKRNVLERSAPTVGFELEQGFASIGNSAADFTRLQASYQHRFQVGRRGNVDLLVRGGTFVNAGYVDFPDFRHFATTEFWFTNPDPIANYRLLNYYQESTNEEYAEVYAHYQFRKFLITQINALHLQGLKEDLFVNYLYTPTSDNYTELGYSLDNIFRFLRVEFVTSFRDFAYEDFGVRLSVSSGFTRIFGQ